MAYIQTLVPDIQALLTTKGWFNDHLAEEFGREVALRLQQQFAEHERKNSLRLSQMGPKCPHALWYSIHHPELSERLPPWAENKYAYGHIIEAWTLVLARASGHTVTGEQDELRVDGVVGHRDCVIDGCVADIKSCSSFQFERFKSGEIKSHDTFGYLDQLDGYLVGSVDDPLVTCKDVGYDLAVDKTLGHMCLYEHHKREASIRSRIAQSKSIVERSTPPQCECKVEPIGKSGNIGLAFPANYNVFKHCCFPGLRTFIYSTGPVYLTHVEREPDVPEVDRQGNRIG